jgi:cysteine-rich repeat protein
MSPKPPIARRRSRRSSAWTRRLAPWIPALGAGCLPALDPALLNGPDAAADGAREAAADSVASDAGPRCVGGAPDGTIQAGEECDDGNLVDADGCSTACRRECPGGIVDEITGACYWLQSPSTTYGKGIPQCVLAGNGARILTLRSDRESELVKQWLDTTAVRLVLLGLDRESDGVTWRSRVAGEPGWSSKRECLGCYQNWDLGQPKLDGSKPLVVMNRTRFWKWTVEPVEPAAGTAHALVCKRDPPGRPENLCVPPCDSSKVYELQALGHRYRVHHEPVSGFDAENRCRAWDPAAHLVIFDSEDERALVTRFGPQATYWIGLARPLDAGGWWWADGVSAANRLVPWSSVQPGPSEVLGAIVPSDAFDTALVQGLSPGTFQVFVCRK